METVQQLKETVLSGRIDDTQYALSTRLLGSSTIDALSATYLQDEQVALQNYQIIDSNGDGSITVTGTGTKLPFTGMTVQATFRLQGAEPLLELQASGQDGWNLGQSFPVLQDSPLASLQFIPTPELHLASYDISAEMKQGIVFFEGTLSQASILGNLGSLFGTHSPRLSGPIDIQNGMPGMTLATAGAESIDLGFSTPLSLTLEACSIPFLNTIANIPDTRTFLRFRTAVPLKAQGKDYSLPLVATLYGPQDEIILNIDLDQVSELITLGLDELSSLAQHISFVDQIPSLPNFHLADLFTLNNIFARINPTASSRLVALGVTILNANPWTLLPAQSSAKAITLENLTITINVPLNAKSPSIAIMATMSIGAQGLLTFSAFSPDYSVAGGLVPGRPLELAEVIDYFIGSPAAAEIPPLEIVSFDFWAKPGAEYSLDIAVQGDWPIALDTVNLHIDAVTLALSYNQATGISATLSGSLTIAGVAVTLTASYSGPDAAWVFTGTAATTTPIHLAGIINDLLPQGTTLPDEIPDLEFSNINVMFAPGSGAFSLTGTYTTAWELPLGLPNLTVSKVDLALSRGPSTAHMAQGPLSCSLKLHAAQLEQGSPPIVDGLFFKSIDLAFDLVQQKGWQLSGTIAASLFDLDSTLSASLQETSTVRTITLQAATSNSLSLNLGNASLTWQNLSVVISKARQPQDGSQGIKLQPSSAYSWSVSTTGGIAVTGVDALTLNGTLRLAQGATGLVLAFKPVAASVRISLPDPLLWVLDLELEAISLIRTGGSKPSWAFDAAIGLRFDNVPARLQSILPTAKAVEGHFHVDSSSVLVSVDSLVLRQDVPLPKTTLGNTTIDLGTAAVEVSQLQVQLGRHIALSASLGFGIPQQMNSIFGSSTVHFFRTYQPPDPTGTTLTSLRVSLDSASGLQVQLLSSPIEAITFQQKGNDTWCNANLGDFGAVTFTLPVFHYDGQSFSASGNFQQATDANGQPIPLKLPLTPLKSLLGACGLKDIAKNIPNGLPLRSLKVYDAQGHHFNGDAFIQALLELGGSNFTLDDNIKSILRTLEAQLDRLPDDFKAYLDIELPTQFQFAFSLSPDGQFQASASVDEKGDASGNRPAIKFLYPNMGLLGPQLTGITLRSFSIGEMLGGSVIRINLDMDVHQFNLLTLLPALVLPEDPVPNLPRTQDLVTHIPIHNLFMLIIYEALIPIPVPIFFDQLGLEYLSLEGVNFQLHGSFPNPLSHFAASDLPTLFSALLQFFSDRAYMLDASKLSHILPTLTIGPNTLQLPQYLGGNSLIAPADPTYNPVIDLTADVAQALNTLKQHLLPPFNLNQVAQAIPLKRRVGQQDLSLGGLKLAATKWLITTPQEFSSLSAEQLALAQLTTDDSGPMLQLLPATQAQTLVTNLPTQIAARQAQIQAHNIPLQNYIASLQAEVNSIQSQIASTQAQINQLTAMLETLKQQPLLPGNLSSLQSLPVQIGQLQGQLSAQRATLNSVTASLTASQQALVSAEADARLNKLNTDLQRARSVLNAAQGQGIVLFLKGTLLNVLSASLGLLGTREGFHTAMHVSGKLADLFDLELTGVVAIDPHASPVFSLAGQSSLAITGKQVFAGDVQIDDQGFLMDGHINLFPSLPLQVVGDGVVRINSQHIYLNTQVDVSLVLQNSTLTLTEASLTIDNGSVTMTARWLGSHATLLVAFGQNTSTIKGTFSFDASLNTSVGPFYDPTTGVKVVDAILLNTTAQASFAVTLSTQQGFAADVSADFKWNNQPFNIPKFSITIPPADLQGIEALLTQNASTAFTNLRYTISDWIKAGVKGLVQVAADFVPAVEAAKKWTDQIWNVASQWSIATWKNTSTWPNEIAQALRNLGPGPVSQTLKDIGYGANEIGGVLRNTFGWNLTDIARQLKSFNYAAPDIGQALRSALANLAPEDQLGPGLLTQTLKDAGFGATDTGQALYKIFSLPDSGAAIVLGSYNFDANATAAMLQTVYHLIVTHVDSVTGRITYDLQAAQEITTDLQQAQYSVNAIGSALNTTCRLPQDQTVQVLQKVGYGTSDLANVTYNTFHWTADQTSQFLKGTLHQTDDAVNSVLHQIGLPGF